jgi:hypothetical protein
LKGRDRERQEGEIESDKEGNREMMWRVERKRQEEVEREN